jgi:large subunit ribosomal protein L33
MAKSKKGNIEIVALKCSECNQQNYVTKKNRRNIEGKLEFKKYCKFDRKHTLHVETRLK